MRMPAGTSPETPIHISKSGTVIGRIVFCFLLIVSLTGIPAVAGSEFWESKDYRQWSQKECKQLLENSPWTRILAIGTWGAYEYHVQFRSALPVRQAIVRQMQLGQNYESLPSDRRQEFDKKAQEYLSTGFADMIVTHITCGPNLDKLTGPASVSPTLLRYWQMQTTELLKNSVFLILAKGDRIPLQQFNVSQGDMCEFQFIFPRQYQGRPVLSAGDKSFKLEFTYPVESGTFNNRSTTIERGLIEFKVDKMLINGEPAY